MWIHLHTEALIFSPFLSNDELTTDFSVFFFLITQSCRNRFSSFQDNVAEARVTGPVPAALIYDDTVGNAFNILRL